VYTPEQKLKLFITLTTQLKDPPEKKYTTKNDVRQFLKSKLLGQYDAEDVPDDISAFVQNTISQVKKVSSCTSDMPWTKWLEELESGFDLDDMEDDDELLRFWVFL
jgi:hypothetical protein